MGRGGVGAVVAVDPNCHRRRPPLSSSSYHHRRIIIVIEVEIFVGELRFSVSVQAGQAQAIETVEVKAKQAQVEEQPIEAAQGQEDQEESSR